MTDSNERWADSSEKATESYGDIKDSTALGRGSDEEEERHQMLIRFGTLPRGGYDTWI